MDIKSSDDQTIYRILVNNKGQFTLVSVARENPLGWNDIGKTGLRSECLAFMKAKYPAITLINISN